jgi:hypothetical protein
VSIPDKFWEMQRSTNDHGIETSVGDLCLLVLAEVIEERGLAIENQLKEIDKSLVCISQNVS